MGLAKSLVDSQLKGNAKSFAAIIELPVPSQGSLIPTIISAAVRVTKTDHMEQSCSQLPQGTGVGSSQQLLACLQVPGVQGRAGVESHLTQEQQA